MSWDLYADKVKEYDPKGAICAVLFGHDGAMWTSPASANIAGNAIQPPELLQFCENHKKGTVPNGLRLGGVKFTFLRDDDDTFCFKSMEDIGSYAKPFCCIRRTKSAWVMGISSGDDRGSNINKGVSAIADYLVSVEM